MADKETTLNDEYSELGKDLEAAWDDSDNEDTLETPEVIVDDDKPTGEEDGGVAAAKSDEGDEKPAEPGDTDDVSAEAADEGGKEEKPDVLSAPVGLPPEAREAWKDTPPVMQKAIAKREQEFNVQLQKSAEGAKRAEGMDRALQPFQQYLQMNGGNSHIGTLLQAGATLQMGSVQQKAQMLASLVMDTAGGGPELIDALDSMLVGNAPASPTGLQADPDYQREVAENRKFRAEYRQNQQYQQQQDTQRLQTEIGAFAEDPQNEFYGDVSNDMITIYNVDSANNGPKKSMKEVYDQACRANPAISTIIASRKAASEIAGKRKAATSITGGPGGPGGTPDQSLRATIVDAYENAGRV